MAFSVQVNGTKDIYGNESWIIRCQDGKTESDRMRLNNNSLGMCGLNHKPTQAEVLSCCPSGKAKLEQKMNSMMNGGTKAPVFQKSIFK